MNRWPKDNQADLIAFYGPPKTRELESQLVDVAPPFRMTYAGKPVKSIKFHRKAAPALAAALNEIWEAYGRDQARIDADRVSIYSGSYNPRKISGSDKWSNHAYGAAIDFDAEHNGFNTGHGTIPQIVVDAFKRQGARWGGDYKNRTDPMHFEFAGGGEMATQQPSQQGTMRVENVTATVFGTPGDGLSDNDTAYSDVQSGWANRLGVALPIRIAGTRPMLRLTNRATGRSATVPVIDVGPWNKTDDWYHTGSRPRAESQFANKTHDDYGRIPRNDAGIDLTPATAAALGLNGKGKVDVEVLGAEDHDILPPVRADDSHAALLAAVMRQNELLLALLQKMTGGVAPIPSLPYPGTQPEPRPEPKPEPSPATPPPAKPGVGTDFIASLLALFGGIGLQGAGMVGAPIGDAGTTAGFLTNLIPLAATAISFFTGSNMLGNIGGGLLNALASRAPANRK